MNRAAVYRATLRHFFAPVADLLYDDESVTEVLINGPDRIYFERNGRLHATDRRFESAAALDAAVRNLAEYVHRRLDDRHHSMDARLPEPEKFRVHAVIPPASRQGVCVSIRKFFRANTTLDWLIDGGSLTPEAAEYLGVMVKAKRNLIVSGGTGSGKTSLLNALSATIPADERIVVIEDTAELRLLQPHAVYLEARPADPKGHGAVTIRDLFVDSLRMRPDRIIVGEVRRGEALDLVQSMLSGHDGALGTVHASSPAHALSRLETLCLMNDVGLPVHVARAQVADAIHVVVQVARLADNTRRVVQIAEVAGMGKKQPYRVRPVYDFRIAGRDADGRVLGGLEWTGRPSRYRRDVEMSGPASAAVQQTARLFTPPDRADAPAIR
jgi:pilus assembly protein CpaF